MPVTSPRDPEKEQLSEALLSAHASKASAGGFPPPGGPLRSAALAVDNATVAIMESSDDKTIFLFIFVTSKYGYESLYVKFNYEK